MDKVLILKGIKEAYKFKTDAEFARFLGISPQTLASWYRRNVFDSDILYSKCKDINPEYILSGSGNIMRNNTTNVGNHNSNSGNITTVDDRLIKLIENAMDALKDTNRVINATNEEQTKQISELINIISKK